MPDPRRSAVRPASAAVAVVLSLLLVACSTPPTEDPAIATLRSERDDLALQVRILTSRVRSLESSRGTLESQVQELKTELSEAQTTPSFPMWDVPTTIPGGKATALGLPDTFTVRVRFISTQPIRASIMTLPQYARWVSTGLIEAAVYPPTTRFDVTFHDAEGCAGYVLVLAADQDAVVTPSFVITRANDIHHLTGFCAR